MVLAADSPLGYLATSLRQQKITAAVLLGFLLSGGLAATNLIVAGRQVEASRNELAHAQLAYRDLATRVTRGYERIRGFAHGIANADSAVALEQKPRAMELTSALAQAGGLAHVLRFSSLGLWAIAVHNLRLSNAVANLLDDLTLAKLQDASLAEARRAITAEVKFTQAQLAGEIDAMQQILTTVDSRGQMPSNQVVDLQKSLSVTRYEVDQQVPSRQVTSLDLAAIQQWDTQGNLGEHAAIGQIGILLDRLSLARDRNERLALRISQVQADIAKRSDPSGSLHSALSDITQRIGELKDQLASIQRLQEAIIGQLAALTHDAVVDIESAIASSGVDLYGLLLRANERSAATVVLSSTLSAKPGSRLLERVASLDGEVERYQRLQPLLRILPLVTPVEDYKVTSPFGMRVDPLTGEATMHEGLDLAHAYLAPVLSPSPGVVVFAGWSGSYGRLVEIDHGLGVHTRYGHLARIDVHVGEAIDFRQRIGLLGNTGHSSGPHVHYEVRVDGRALNPMRFLTAGAALAKAGLLSAEPPLVGAARPEPRPTLAGSEFRHSETSAQD